MKSLVFATLLLAAGSLSVAHADSPKDPQQITGTARLDFTKVISLEQLQTLLEQEGYTDIQLSPVQPNISDPRPDIQANSPNGRKHLDLAATPVHPGWDGTAVRNGKRVNIVIDSSGFMKILKHL
jgi:hypothetical protein